MAAKRKRDLFNHAVSSTTQLTSDRASDLSYLRANSSSPLNLSKMNGDHQNHHLHQELPVLSPTALIADRYRNLSLKSPNTASIREEDEKIHSPNSMKRPKSETDNWSDCGSPLSSSTSLKDPLSPATPLNVAHIISQLHMPITTRPPKTTASTFPAGTTTTTTSPTKLSANGALPPSSTAKALIAGECFQPPPVEFFFISVKIT
ncbi:hypothetical protein BV898_11180 [Hypsibius exemplaris]|uniref:Uncharacterized protein n=1 Tax=Hypsibius exemplaris TaxID=2072580 RepID=A0A1W0WHJ0_HYPEX|nr:hypothetical protein BV898_11180 [Hypsibius exemplaris]